MAVSQLVTRAPGEGKRLMLTTDRELADHDKELTVGAEVRSYPNGREIVFVRTWLKTPWCFHVTAIDRATGLELDSITGVDTWQEAKTVIEGHMTDLELI